MNSLFELASGNKNLKFLDDANGISYSINELPLTEIENGPKKIIFAYLDNSIQSIGIFWSAMKSNHCVALLSSKLDLQLKLRLEENYKPTYIFDINRNEIDYYFSNNGLFTRQKDEEYPIHQDIKVLLSTSGTTGSPKFVKLSESNLIENANSIIQYLPINSNDVTPLNLPIYYSYGLSILTSNSLKGGTIVCSNSDVLSKEFWEKLQHYRYTSIAGVPFVFEMLDRIGFLKKKYVSLRYLTQAGGKLNKELVVKFGNYAENNAIDFFVMYGATEATARMAYMPPSDLLDHPDSIGKPIPNGEFMIDEDTHELCYKGPNVFGGYVTQISELNSFTKEEWLRTGDLGKVDSSGYYYIIGRIKRIVKVFGSRVNLDEIESILFRDLNLAVKCIGIEDKVLVVFHLGILENVELLFNHLVKIFKIHKSIIRVIELTEFPLTSNGKIDYKKLEEVYGNS